MIREENDYSLENLCSSMLIHLVVGIIWQFGDIGFDCQFNVHMPTLLIIMCIKKHHEAMYTQYRFVHQTKYRVAENFDGEKF